VRRTHKRSASSKLQGRFRIENLLLLNNREKRRGRSKKKRSKNNQKTLSSKEIGRAEKGGRLDELLMEKKDYSEAAIKTSKRKIQKKGTKKGQSHILGNALKNLSGANQRTTQESALDPWEAQIRRKQKRIANSPGT